MVDIYIYIYIFCRRSQLSGRRVKREVKWKATGATLGKPNSKTASNPRSRLARIAKTSWGPLMGNDINFHTYITLSLSLSLPLWQAHIVLLCSFSTPVCSSAEHSHSPRKRRDKAWTAEESSTIRGATSTRTSPSSGSARSAWMTDWLS